MLPDLLQAEFTAQMESTLDLIASGQQDWQQYLTSWNQEYFEPTLTSAWNALGGRPKSDSIPPKVRSKSELCCPNCQDKVMLRCSNSKGIKDTRHKDVAFFRTFDGNWWSKKYGVLN